MYEYPPNYREKAAECFKAALEAGDPLYREVQLSLALSWFTLSRMVVDADPRGRVPLRRRRSSDRAGSCE